MGGQGLFPFMWTLAVASPELGVCGPCMHSHRAPTQCTREKVQFLSWRSVGRPRLTVVTRHIQGRTPGKDRAGFDILAYVFSHSWPYSF